MIEIIVFLYKAAAPCYTEKHSKLVVSSVSGGGDYKNHQIILSARIP